MNFCDDCAEKAICKVERIEDCPYKEEYRKGRYKFFAPSPGRQVYKKWTDKDREIITRMVKQGSGRKEIAKRLGVDKGNLVTWCSAMMPGIFKKVMPRHDWGKFLSIAKKLKYEGKSCREIGEITGIKEKTIMNKLYKERIKTGRWK